MRCRGGKGRYRIGIWRASPSCAALLVRQRASRRIVRRPERRVAAHAPPGHRGQLPARRCHRGESARPPGRVAGLGPGDLDWLGSLQPDRLGELHALRELVASPESARACMTGMDSRQARRAMTLLARASSDDPDAGVLLSQTLHDVADFIVGPGRRRASPRSLHKATSSSATAARRSAGGSSAASATAAAQHSPTAAPPRPRHACRGQPLGNPHSVTLGSRRTSRYGQITHTARCWDAPRLQAVYIGLAEAGSGRGARPDRAEGVGSLPARRAPREVYLTAG
jgi:hypothetical protein